MEESAFERNARTWRQVACEVCLRAGTGEMEADDVAQEVMLRLWQMRDELDRYRRPEALVTVMARRLLIDHWRKRQAMPLDTRIDRIAAMASSPHELLEESEDAQWLAQRMAQLPTTQHTILYMRQVECRGRGEIARLLGMGEASVSTLLARARRQLLEELKRRNSI